MKKAYLVCVSVSNINTGEETNTNKFYKMEQVSDTEWIATYGRVGKPPKTFRYPMEKWDEKYRQKTQKVRNGYIYKDQTESIKVEDTTVYTGFKSIEDSKVNSFMNKLQGFSSNYVNDNYTINPDQVTDNQIREAQILLNKITIDFKDSKSNLNTLNDNLIELYTVIPRKMPKVKDFLLVGDNNDKNIQLLTREQDKLDAMLSQVTVKKQVTVSAGKDTILESMRLTMIPVNKMEEELVLKYLTTESRSRYVQAYKIISSRKAILDKHYPKDNRRLLWHGSRNENWLNILQSGLLIKPTGVITTGSMFGNGIYFADRTKKSINYSSVSGSYWAGGTSQTGLVALYDVYLGNYLSLTNSDWNLSFDKLRQRGNYDSVFAHKGHSLYNNEFIIYQKNQCAISYIIEIR